MNDKWIEAPPCQSRLLVRKPVLCGSRISRGLVLPTELSVNRVAVKFASFYASDSHSLLRARRQAWAEWDRMIMQAGVTATPSA